MPRVEHGFAPVFDSGSRVLILGSVPSVKSLERGFYYANPQNRFWKVLEAVTGSAVPEDIPGRKSFLLAHRVALWDVVASCEREGSLDANIRDPLPNDIPGLLDRAHIRRIFANGGGAYRYLAKFFPGLSAVCLPSTSPANRGNFRLEDWLQIAEYL